MISRLDYKYSGSDFIHSMVGMFKEVSKEEMLNIFSVRSVFFTNHARTSLRIALSALNLPKDSYIGVQVYNCITVFEAIKSAGYQPLFIDIDDSFIIDVNDLTRKKNNMGALIVTHMFGIPQPVKEIRKLVGDIPIIEDCAHSFLSKFDDKNLTGTFGDISVFSIGMGKFPSVGDGGFLFVNNQDYLNRVLSYYNELRRPGFVLEFKSIVIKSALYFLSLPLVYKLFTLPFLKSADKKMDFRRQYVLKERSALKNNVYQFNKRLISVNSLLREQKSNAQTFIGIIKKSNVGICDFPSGWNAFMLPVLTDRQDFVIREFKNRGIEVGKHFASCIDWAIQFGYSKGDCMNAESVTQRIVTIPTYGNLKKSQVKKIEDSIKHIL